MSSARDRLAQLQPLGRCTLLALVLIAALAVAVPFGIALRGTAGMWAAVAADATVLISSMIALLAAEFFHRPSDALWGMLFGMGIRMSLPLAACMFVYLSVSSLAAAGFVFFVLGFYFVALPVDTLLAISRLENQAKA